jgi:GNAT superfamily N-acetyltransferase
MLARTDVGYLVAETSSEALLAGAAGMSDDGALLHLFVAPAYQRQGLGRRLWELLRDRVLRAGNPGVFRVNSSVGAVPIYQRFGFRVNGARVERHGGAYVPMVFGLPLTS